MIKLKDKKLLEEEYKLIGLNAIVLDGVEYIGNEHIKINTNNGAVSVYDTVGAEFAINLYIAGVLCLAND